MLKNNKYIISLGGSVLAPDEINVKLLKDFCLTVKKETEKGNKFIIIVGGGGICRKYQRAASLAGNVSDENKDWLGIQATRLNAQLLSGVLKSYKINVLFQETFNSKSFGKYDVIVSGGLKPGNSTDFAAVKAAVSMKIKMVINLGKPHYVFTADPKKDKTATPIKELTWEEYFKIIPSKWTPGLSTPFDPIASRLAKKHNISVIVADGKNLNNFKNILQGKTYKGTTIQ